MSNPAVCSIAHAPEQPPTASLPFIAKSAPVHRGKLARVFGSAIATKERAECQYDAGGALWKTTSRVTIVFAC